MYDNPPPPPEVHTLVCTGHSLIQGREALAKKTEAQVQGFGWRILVAVVVFVILV